MVLHNDDLFLKKSKYMYQSVLESIALNAHVLGFNSFYHIWRVFFVCVDALRLSKKNQL